MTDSIHRVVRRHAEADPTAPALILPSDQVTYGALVADAERLVEPLTRAGVRPGTVVAVLLEPSAELVSVLLAVLSCGAAYAVLDRSWPAARLAAVARQLPGQLAVVAGGDQYPAFPDRLTLRGAELVGSPARPPAIVVTDGTPAMVFFTSGSTGAPKAVLAPHRAISRLFTAPTFATFDSSTVMPQAAAMPWDAFALELWGPLMSGGACALVTERPLTPPALRALTARAGLTSVFLTTSLFHLMVEEDLEAFIGLGTVLVGGEKLSAEHAARFVRRWPSIRLVNGYGPVESAVFALTYQIGPDLPAGDVPLGSPVPRTQVRVLQDGRPVPPDEVGELVIGGDGLALGYVGDPELTAQKFVMVSIDGVPTRCYRTGDLGRVDAHGIVHFHGRLDRQVKVRGHRVEPTGIEQSAMARPGVRRCVVLPRWDEHGGCTGLALFYLRDCGGPSPAELAESLRAELPAYSVPDEISELAEFPLTATGKLDSARLLERSGERPPVRPAVEPASTGELVAAEVAELLGIAEVDPEASLSSLGISSLTAIRLCTRLNHRFQRPLAASQLLRTPTVRGLAHWLDTTDPEPVPAPTPAGPMPAALTSTQHSFLLRHLAVRSDLENHCILSWTITGPVDAARLAAAVAAVHRRHGYLRSRYQADDIALAIPADPAAPFEQLSVPVAAEEKLTERLMQPFDLAAGAVWRAVLVSAPQHAVFGVAVHHVAFDGWSQHLLSQELGAGYAGDLVVASPPDPTRVVAAIAEVAAATELPEQRSFWRTALADLPAVSWPQPGEPGRTVLEFQLGTAELMTCGLLARRHRTGVLAVLLTAVGRAVFEHTGQSDLGFGVPVNHRPTEELQLPIGCLIDMVCIRLRDRALDSTAAAVSAALAHAELPFAEVVRAVRPRRSRRNPLYQIVVSVQNSPAPTLSLPGCDTVLDDRTDHPPPQAELLVELFTGRRPVLRITRDPHAVAAASFVAMAHQVRANLIGADQVDRPLTQV